MVRLSGLARACPRVCSVRVSGAVFSEAVLECVRKCRICPSFAGLVVGCDSDPIATCQTGNLSNSICAACSIMNLKDTQQKELPKQMSIEIVSPFSARSSISPNFRTPSSEV